MTARIAASVAVHDGIAAPEPAYRLRRSHIRDGQPPVFVGGCTGGVVAMAPADRRAFCRDARLVARLAIAKTAGLPTALLWP